MTGPLFEARPQTVSVSQLNEYVKSRLASDPFLRNVHVGGEISNFKAHGSGHIYFTLKDSECSVSCVMFARDAARLAFRPENGQTVTASGRVSAYPRDGSFQLYCSALEPDGLGALCLGFEQLKAKLEQEGLFRPEHKINLPRYPRKIALITSPTGAAVQDMIRIIGRRWPVARVIIIPVPVQGKDAPDDIAAALKLYSDRNIAEVAVLGRGGGSIEDLWAFNDEKVARAIFASRLPVVSAVGHEPDVTIADFAADLRAATPSHAAEMITPDISDLTLYLGRLGQRLSGALGAKLAGAKSSLAALKGRHVLQSPANCVKGGEHALRLASGRLEAASSRYFSERRGRFLALTSKLEALSPLAVLSRGYAIASSEYGVIKSADEVSAGDGITVRLDSGTLRCLVTGRLPGVNGDDTDGTTHNI